MMLMAPGSWYLQHKVLAFHFLSTCLVQQCRGTNLPISFMGFRQRRMGYRWAYHNESRVRVLKRSLRYRGCRLIMSTAQAHTQSAGKYGTVLCAHVCSIQALHGGQGERLTDFFGGVPRQIRVAHCLDATQQRRVPQELQVVSVVDKRICLQCRRQTPVSDLLQLQIAMCGCPKREGRA